MLIDTKINAAVWPISIAKIFVAGMHLGAECRFRFGMLKGFRLWGGGCAFFPETF